MFHYIYKTTCVVTNRFYVGMHSTANINDGYLGSGTLLLKSVAKHGPEAHVCEQIEFLPSRDALKQREAELVSKELLADPLCMNIKLGGDGGWDHVVASKQNWKRIKSDPELSAAFKARTQANLKKLKAASVATRFTETTSKIYGELAKSHAAIDKRKETFKKNAHQQGQKNNQFGTCWIYSLTEQVSKKIKKTDLQQYLSDGWLVGRKINFR